MIPFNKLDDSGRETFGDWKDLHVTFGDWKDLHEAFCDRNDLHEFSKYFSSEDKQPRKFWEQSSLQLKFLNWLRYLNALNSLLMNPFNNHSDSI